MKTKTLTGAALRAAAALAMAAAIAAADVPGSVLTTDNKTFTGQIRWKPMARKIVVTITRGTKQIETEFAPEQISKMAIAKPPGLDEAVQAVQAGRGESAIGTLDRIAQDYAMLQWDEPATRWLVEAHMQAGNAAAAVKAAERVVAMRPEAGYKGEMAITYWQALLKTDRASKLETLLDEAVKSGLREPAAFALILRGDLILKRGESKENIEAALRDGYLRVITLFRAVRTAQPEALYKTAKCLEKLGQTARAGEQMDLLRKEYAGSEWARKP
jgi:tetratricopeptide (TPR) repeat protein